MPVLLEPLLKEAKKAVPKELRANTPLYFFATAGLRLLPGHQAEDLLQEVRSLLRQYPFNTKVVEIMKGEDEGALQWLSINFLHGAISLSQKLQVSMPHHVSHRASKVQ